MGYENKTRSYTFGNISIRLKKNKERWAPITLFISQPEV